MTAPRTRRRASVRAHRAARNHHDGDAFVYDRLWIGECPGCGRQGVWCAECRTLITGLHHPSGADRGSS